MLSEPNVLYSDKKQLMIIFGWLVYVV